MYQLIFPESFEKRARKFLRQHPELKGQYQKTLELLCINPYHPSLRLHKLKGRLSMLSSVSINMQYRITLELMMTDKVILLVNVGTHEQVY